MARKKYIAWSPVRELMGTAGAKIVSKDAVDYLIDYFEDYATEITNRALTLTKHSGRKKITKADIDLAIKNY
ncbi:MAG: histone [Candidatus Lokiarchaeota archaeon]|nr:histone [Candidatus Lokiarchaeota archaeon]